jgi:type VI protein secretion system component Hcp
VTGGQIPSVELLGRRTVSGGSAPVTFMRYCFQQVFVTKIDHSGGAGDDQLAENVSFAYQTVSEQYSRLNASGGVAQTVFAGWNATTEQTLIAYPNPCGT